MDWTSIIVSAITAAATIVTVVIQTKKTEKKVEKTAAETQRMTEVNDHKTYLLLLLKSYPTKADEIYFVARHYFADLDGDSFVVPIFEDWLQKQNQEQPEWFLEAKEKHPRVQR